MKVIGVHMDRCTGCKTCELYWGAERAARGRRSSPPFRKPRSPTPHPRRGRTGGRLRPMPALPPGALSGRLSSPAPPSGGEERHGDHSRGSLHRLLTCTAFCPYGVIYPSPSGRSPSKATVASTWKSRSVGRLSDAGARWWNSRGSEELLRETAENDKGAMAEAEAGNEGSAFDLGR